MSRTVSPPVADADADAADADQERLRPSTRRNIGVLLFVLAIVNLFCF